MATRGGVEKKVGRNRITFFISKCPENIGIRRRKRKKYSFSKVDDTAKYDFIPFTLTFTAERDVGINGPSRHWFFLRKKKSKNCPPLSSPQRISTWISMYYRCGSSRKSHTGFITNYGRFRYLPVDQDGIWTKFWICHLMAGGGGQALRYRMKP